MMRKVIFASLTVMTVGLFVYYYLGGFNEVDIELVETEEYIIAGYSYHGPYDQDVLQDLFFQVKEYVEADVLKGIITVLNYDSAVTEADSIHQLIGVRLQAEPLNKPQEVVLETIPAGRAVRATIRAHPLVMPNPESILEQVRSFAVKNNLELKALSIEQYVESEEIWVDIPIR
jgi:DNA gyrase inhibitor GyrI